MFFRKMSSDKKMGGKSGGSLAARGDAKNGISPAWSGGIQAASRNLAPNVTGGAQHELFGDVLYLYQEPNPVKYSFVPFS